ncbi:hypothetical protein FOA52_013903 [Chlamydomonas sp. UWO 241]|nr:hypothetical protein FOA52_013903 [Chlamydomonas sp. UWO 241]
MLGSTTGHRTSAGGRTPCSSRAPSASRITVARAAATMESAKAAAVELPEELRNNVVVLEAPNGSGGTARVYVMGVSHVSKIQAQQVKTLIRAVRPEVVCVELCKERVGLLVDDRMETQATNLWHVRKVMIEGLPSYDKAYPTVDELKSLLSTRSGLPVSMQDIEADVKRLLATGLFKSGAPGAAAGTFDDAPEFGVLNGEDGQASLETVPPLRGVRFSVVMRELPPILSFSVRVDSSLAGMSPDEAALQKVADEAIVEVKDGGKKPLSALLRAKARFAEVVGAPVSVAFSGCESGNFEATIKAVKLTDPPYVSGFEGSAINGEGWGIDTFRPARPLTKLSSKMYLSVETLEAMRAQVRGVGSEPSAPSPATDADTDAVATAATPGIARVAVQPATSFREWTLSEMDAAKRSDPEPDEVADTLSQVLMLLYSRAQMAVGRTVGIERGAAWQAALQAASEVGAQQLLLVDRPSLITDRRLGDGLLREAGPRLAAGAGLILAYIVGALFADSPVELELGGLGGAVAVAAALAWPVLGPFVQIQRLAAMGAEEIEAAVRPAGPLSSGASGKLFGEDALLEWPGAGSALLDERDEFMARAGAAAVKGKGLVPAYVLDRVDGRLVWRFMQAEGAPAEVSPHGFGDGAYTPLGNVTNVVAIVGTAHVPGIMARWGDATWDPKSVEGLLR